MSKPSVRFCKRSGNRETEKRKQKNVDRGREAEGRGGSEGAQGKFCGLRPETALGDEGVLLRLLLSLAGLWGAEK